MNDKEKNKLKREIIVACVVVLILIIATLPLNWYHHKQNYLSTLIYTLADDKSTISRDWGKNGTDIYTRIDNDISTVLTDNLQVGLCEKGRFESETDKDIMFNREYDITVFKYEYDEKSYLKVVIAPDKLIIRESEEETYYYEFSAHKS